MQSTLPETTIENYSHHHASVIGTVPTGVIDLQGLAETLIQTNLGYLGIIITILLFLGGAFYIFNFKPIKDTFVSLEKTVVKLKEEVEQNLSSSKKEIQIILESFQVKINKDVSDHTKQKNDLLSSTVDTRIAGLETVISVKFSSVIEKELGSLHTLVMSEVGDRIRELEKNFLEKLELQKLDFEKRFEAVNEKQIESKKAIATLNRKTRELEIFKYSQKGQMGAIYGSIELLKEDIDAKNWKIEGDLEDLSKEIEGVNLKSEVITQIEEQLARLDDAPKYKYLIDQVKEMYKKKE